MPPQAANILVAGSGHVVLGDFGACAALELKGRARGPLRRTSIDQAHAYLAQPKFKGTPQYHPPGVRAAAPAGWRFVAPHAACTAAYAITGR